MTLGYHYGLPETNAGEHSYGGNYGYLSCLPRVPLRCRNQPMWRGGNEGAYMLPPRATLSCRSPRRNLMISQYRTPTDHLGYPPNRHSRSWRLVLLNWTRPPKPSCDASCRGLRGTGVVISRCRERSPRSTRQHPVVFMPSTRMGCCGW
jgi:hypothetical protein